MKHIIFSLLAAATIHGMAAKPATITVSADKRPGRIEPILYGQFIEHLGRCITGGIFEPGSKLSDENGFGRRCHRSPFARHSAGSGTSEVLPTTGHPKNMTEYRT